MMITTMTRQKPDLHPKNKGSFTSHPHRHGMRCLQLVALYDMQEDAAGQFFSQPAGGSGSSSGGDDGCNSSSIIGGNNSSGSSSSCLCFIDISLFYRRCHLARRKLFTTSIITAPSRDVMLRL